MPYFLRSNGVLPLSIVMMNWADMVARRHFNAVIPCILGYVTTSFAFDQIVVGPSSWLRLPWWGIGWHCIIYWDNSDGQKSLRLKAISFWCVKADDVFREMGGYLN